MKKDENKSALRFSKVRGALIMLLGVVLLTSGISMNNRSQGKGLNILMVFGGVVILVGAGFQIREIVKTK